MIRTRMLLSVLVLLAFVAGGCGGSSSSGGGDRQGPGVGPLSPPAPLTPLLASEPQASNAFNMIYPQLVQYGPGLKIAPDWATSWSHSKDGLVWTFHLAPGGKWSDGVPLTS